MSKLVINPLMRGYFKICKFEKHYVDIYIYKKLHFSHKKKICTFPINKDSGILMSACSSSIWTLAYFLSTWASSVNFRKPWKWWLMSNQSCSKGKNKDAQAAFRAFWHPPGWKCHHNCCFPKRRTFSGVFRNRAICHS